MYCNQDGNNRLGKMSHRMKEEHGKILRRRSCGNTDRQMETTHIKCKYLRKEKVVQSNDNRSSYTVCK
jgi:transcriptional regulator NrdR family protein